MPEIAEVILVIGLLILCTVFLVRELRWIRTMQERVRKLDRELSRLRGDDDDDQ